MAVVCARNEERVIRALLLSLLNQDYPRELIDIYVIADNCTDNTVNIARSLGVNVYERFNPTHLGKGYALEWFFAQILSQKPYAYDAFCVFDADNIVDAGFFRAMNHKLCCGEEIVQGYRDMKNPIDNWISISYSFHYWSNNLLYHLPRYNLGLSPLINGTGFMVSMKVLREQGGWHTKTMTEDIEFSIINIAKGRKIGWATDAIVYDEQPLKFRQSYKQRLRWSVGHLQCFTAYFPTLIKALFKHGNLTIVDTLLYISGMPMLFISFLLLFVYLVGIQIGFTNESAVFTFALCFFLFTICMPIAQVVVTMLIEKRLTLARCFRGLLSYPVFLLSWVFINVMSVFKLNDITWERVEHTRNIEPTRL
jgi:cellulose synthase/poly-beta-1,6-N-acetylglucosamine synthase-like glycosyltransferase